MRTETGRQAPAYRRLVQHTMSAEAFAAFQLAFLRPFAVPRMADVLLRVGSILKDAELRAYRTGLQMYEVICGGLESPRARRVLSHINRAHAAHTIAPKDFDYVLDAFVVVPVRHMEVFGWRSPTDAERDSAVAFYRGLGARLGIRGLPPRYVDVTARFDAYESEHLKASASTVELGRLTIDVLRARLPTRLQRHASALFSAQINDDRVTDALGLPRANRALQRALVPALKVHGAQTALRHRRGPFFSPGQPARVFPDGYQLDDIL